MEGSERLKKFEPGKSIGYAIVTVEARRDKIKPMTAMPFHPSGEYGWYDRRGNVNLTIFADVETH